jgi:CheY-like chemotaxis protein
MVNQAREFRKWETAGPAGVAALPVIYIGGTEVFPMASVLVVEDEPISAMALQESLERMGHDVPAVVDSGDGVVGAAVAHRPDLVIMDINLRSFIDGVDAAERLRMVSEAPVIYLTAYPSRGSQDRALRTRPAAYLIKPVDEVLLRDCVDRALRPAGEAR